MKIIYFFGVILSSLISQDHLDRLIQDVLHGSRDSAAYPEKFHGLFTYFLLKGLQGSAKGSDKQLTIGELYDYVKENVSSQAGYLDKEQDPTFMGSNKSRVLVNY